MKIFFYINLHLVDGLEMKFTACCRTDARGSAEIFTVCDAYRYFVGQALLTSKSRSRREYLIPTNNIIVLDHFFNFFEEI